MKKLLSFALCTMIVQFSCTPDRPPQRVEQWDYFELQLQGPSAGNPFKEVNLEAEFKSGTHSRTVRGFYDGSGVYKIRFMPGLRGKWSYTTSSNVSSLDGHSGSFECVAPSPGNHGPVSVFNSYGFRYADKTPYYQVGTTCYAWAHQGDSLEEVTLNTLSEAPFNKLRMCIFPKSYVYNLNEPVYYPFVRDSAGKHDFERFNPAFWEHMEKRILQLQDLGIEADLILFHPYDRWGYATMPDSVDDFYLCYVIPRFSAFRNVWWSAANEFDFMDDKSMDDWHRYFRIIAEEDPYDHSRSIHNGAVMYDHSLPWITHASIQSTHFDSARVWRERWKKPLVYDECRYEGDVPQGWGNLTPEEMTAMFWKSLITGSWAGHGETYKHPEDILWWSKGGVLHGKSPERIAFFKTYLEELPETGIEPMDQYSAGNYGERYYYYFDEETPAEWSFDLPGRRNYRVVLIDTWNMKADTLEGLYQGSFTIPMPGKPYMAVKIESTGPVFPVGKPELVRGGIVFQEDARIIFVDTATVRLRHSFDPEIRYTLDGSEPDRDDQEYDGPFRITEPARVKVAAFEQDKKGKTASYEFMPVSLQPALDIKDPEPGIEYTYYTGTWTTLPDFDKLQPARSGVLDEVSLDIERAADYFGMVFRGYIRVPYDGLYTFYTASDDGSKILIDAKEVVINDGQHGVREEFGQIALEAGFHEFEVQFFDNWYEEVLKLYFFHEKTGLQDVTGELLYY